MSSYKKCELVKVINNHFLKQGKRLNNLNKSTQERLLKITEKYNINIDEGIEELKNQKKQEAQDAKDRKMKEKRDEAIKNRLIEQTIEYLNKHNKMNEWRRQCMEEYYAREYPRYQMTEEDLAEARNACDKHMEKKRKWIEKYGCENPEINGIVLCMGWMTERDFHLSQEQYDADYYEKKEKYFEVWDVVYSDHDFVAKFEKYVISVKRKQMI
jgi:hypothetical protein